MGRVFGDPAEIWPNTRGRRALRGLLFRYPRLQRLQWWQVLVALAIVFVLGATAWHFATRPKPIGARVLATVDGEPITAAALAELDPGSTAEDPAAQRRLLDAAIERQVVINVARKAGLDRDPQVTQALRQGESQLLGNALARRLVGEVAITDAAARAFMAAHPWRYGKRAILVFEGAPVDTALATGKVLAKADTLPAAIESLRRVNAPFTPVRQLIDTANLPDAMAAQLGTAAEGRLLGLADGGKVLLGAVIARGTTAMPDAILLEQARGDAATAERQSRLRAAFTRMRRQAAVTYSD